MRRPVLALAALAAGTLPAAADAKPVPGRTTVQQRLTGSKPKAAGDFVRLGTVKGEGYRVRALPGLKAAKRRAARRRSLAYLAQLSDFQLADEESPLRVETADPLGDPFTAAWRPQEALNPWVVDASIRQVRRFRRSPLKGAGGKRAKLALAVTTGDSIDNMQRNELGWVLTELEGGRLDPNSGSSDPKDYATCPPGTGGPAEAKRYTGVQDKDDMNAGPSFYDPDAPSGPYASWPRFPGLMDRAQKPFVAAGLPVPTYVAFGNHDALVQGNAAATSSFESVATGCVKTVTPTTPLGRRSTAARFRAALTPGATGAVPVPPDPRRSLVSKPQYKALHKTKRSPRAHGFGLISPAEEKASHGAAGYYAFTPKRGLRFIVLDTVSEGGVAGPSADGNVDDPQYRWLERELQAATKRDEAIVLFSHHGITSLTANVPDEAAPSCGPTDRHGHPQNPGCDLDPRTSTPLHLGADMTALVLRYPHVVAWVAGHSHLNAVAPYTGPNGRGFWMVRSAAEADWPVQERLVELMDNEDGTLSVFGTMLDVAAPVGIPASGKDASRFSDPGMAAVARVLAYNDPQAGQGTGEGVAADRNVELLVRDPRVPLTLRARPSKAKRGRTTTFTFRALRRGRPVRGATVSFAGRKRRTGKDGRARIRVRLRRATGYPAVVRQAGRRTGRIRVRGTA